MKPQSGIYARLIGTGSALPVQCISNEQIVSRLSEQGIETSDKWIFSRTGIQQRHLVQPGETTTSLAAQAAKQAISSSGIGQDEIDLIIVATSTPDQVFPSTACGVQAILANTCAACFDVQAVCSGFVYALTVANAMIQNGQARNALVIGADVFSRILDWSDRGTCVLFGDGAGAVVLTADPTPGILACKLQADGQLHEILKTSSRVESGQILGNPFLQMDGQAVFKQAVSVLSQSALDVLEQAGLSSEKIDWLVPHQANIRILQAIAKRLDLSEDKVVVTVNKHGNTSAASVPLALDNAVRDGRIQSNQIILLQGVGGGFTWGSVLLKIH